MKQITFLCLLLFACSSVLWGQEPAKQEPVKQETAKPETPPQPAPTFALKDLRGKTVKLENFKGKIVLLNFWATWCIPCRTEMPEFIRLQTEYGGKGLQIVGVTYEPEKLEIVSRVARTRKINYPLLFGNEELSKIYGIEEVLPVTVIIDRDGKIRDRILGLFETKDFEEKVLPLLK